MFKVLTDPSSYNKFLKSGCIESKKAVLEIIIIRVSTKDI